VHLLVERNFETTAHSETFYKSYVINFKFIFSPF